MRIFRITAAAVAAVGLLAGGAIAQPVDLSDVGASPILIIIDAEDSDCTNANPGAAFFPNSVAAPATCLVFATGGAGLYTDLTDTIYGTLTHVSTVGTVENWNLAVTDAVWGAVITAALAAAGAGFTAITESYSVDIAFDTATGTGTAVAGNGTGNFYSASGTFGPLVIELTGLAPPGGADAPYYGQADSLLVPNPEVGLPLSVSCAGHALAPSFPLDGLGIPTATIPPFTGVATAATAGTLVTDAAAAWPPDPTTPVTGKHTGPTSFQETALIGVGAGIFNAVVTNTATTMTLSDATAFPAATPLIAVGYATGFGPPDPAVLGAAGTLCDPVGFVTSPGITLTGGTTNLTSLVSVVIALGGVGGPGATAATWAPFDFRMFLASDTDGDGVPDGPLGAGPPVGFDSCSAIFQTAGVDDCDTDMDGFGNVCDGDFGPVPPGGDGAVDFGDLGPFSADLTAGFDSGVGTDQNCDGAVDFGDLGPFSAQLTAGAPGPSSLACAGTIPCP